MAPDCMTHSNDGKNFRNNSDFANDALGHWHWSSLLWIITCCLISHHFNQHWIIIIINKTLRNRFLKNFSYSKIWGITKIQIKSNIAFLPIIRVIAPTVNLALPRVRNFSLSMSMSATMPQVTDRKEYKRFSTVSTAIKSMGSIWCLAMMKDECKAKLSGKGSLQNRNKNQGTDNNARQTLCSPQMCCVWLYLCITCYNYLHNCDLFWQ